MPIESVMSPNHLIFCHPPPVLLSIRVFSNELALPIRWPKYWTFSFNISSGQSIGGSASTSVQDFNFRMDWLDLLAVPETLKSLLQPHSSKAPILQCLAFLMVQLSHLCMTTGKTIAVTRQNFIGKIMYTYRMIQFVVQQKLTQHCKPTIP